MKLEMAGHKHILRICNAYCLSTATMVARTRLIVTLYVHCCLFHSPPYDTRNNPQKLNIHLSYLKILTVPHTKHTPSPLKTNQLTLFGGNNCYFLEEIAIDEELHGVGIT